MAGYSVTFSVVDNATKQIDAINRRMTAMRAPMDRLSKQVSRFVDVSGLRTIERGFSSIASAAGKVLRTLVEIVPVMGALTGAATIGGMAKLVSSYAAWSQSLTRTADNLGLTTQQLQQFEDATRLAGGNVSDMDSALKSLYKVQSDFLRGQASADQIGWLNRLGISMRDASGHARNMADLMPEVVRKIAAIKNPADRAAASAALLGDANSNLVNTFRQSHQSFGQWMTDASRYTELTDKQKDQLQSFAEAQGRVATAFDHLGQQVSATLAKNFTPFLNMISDFVDKHQQEIIAAVDNISQKFAAWLENPQTWKSIEKGLGDLINALTWVSTHLDSIKTVAEVIAGIFVTKWGIQAVAAVAQLAAAIGTIGAGGGGAAGAAAAAGGAGLLGALGAVAAIAGALVAAGAVGVENKKLNKTMDQQAADMGFEKQGEGWSWKKGSLLPSYQEPKFFNPKTGETLSYSDMQKRLGYGPSGMNPFQPNAGRGTPAPGPLNLPTDNIQRGAAIRDRLSKDLGLTGEQASGIVGNLQAESGLQAVQEKNPLGGGRGGFGWAQWTGPRRVAFEQYAKSHALSPTSDEANYGFLTQELQSKEYAGTLAKLRQEKTAGGAAATFEAGFERPAVSNAGVRAGYASQFAAASAPAQPAQGPAAAAPPVQIAQGPPVAVPPPTANVNGAVDVNITGKNLPPDSAVTARGSGAVNVPPPRVEYQDFATV